MVMSKEERKKTDEELQGFLMFRKRGYWVKNKKGKGSYDRHTFNKKEDYDRQINQDYLSEDE